MAEPEDALDPVTDPVTDLGNEPRRMRRSNHYHRARARREAKQAADTRFYRGVFAVSGVVVMFVLLVAAIALNGGQAIGGSAALGDWTAPWVFGASRLEVFGLIIIAIIGAIMYWRMRRKR